MEELLQQIEAYKNEIEQSQVQDADALETFRIKWLGTKGVVKTLMGEMKNVPVDKKREFGR
jgi:phenylalanyl-tRNA synthetase alpha chain